jgi:hypothetical protein
VCATAEPAIARRAPARLISCALVLAQVLSAAAAEARQEGTESNVSRAASVGIFVAGAAAGLVSHEGGHLFWNVVFDADPRLQRVEFHGIPFFAITHRTDLSPRREFVISSAGFWVQHAVDEWLLTSHPRLREKRAPFRKGLLAFNVLASVAYSGAAFARAGPDERDTRGMALSARVDERWIGALILAPAVMDAWRYFDPEAKLPVWLSRGMKIGGVLLVLR